MIKKLPWILPAVFLGWNITSLIALVLAGNKLPVALTNILSLAYVVYFPITPLLRPLGLTEGEYFRGPTVLGTVLAATLYSLLLYGVGRLLRTILLKGKSID